MSEEVSKYKSIASVSTKFTTWWRWLTIAGPGSLVAVGYIDPGNWATDLAGGSHAGYALLSIVLISSLIAMLLQVMSARLGIATGKDLAVLSREIWPRLAWPTWIMIEFAIIATDIAEVLGSAIALKLLFSIPIVIGVVFSVCDVMLILMLDRRGARRLERMIVSLLFIIACGFFYELMLAKPVFSEVLRGFIPSSQIILDPELFYLAVGVVGATVMPHNLYLHSSLVAERWSREDKKTAANFAKYDTLSSLGGAMLLNAALVMLAASVFYHHGHTNVAEITDAHQLLMPLMGTHVAGIVFAIMLLAAGQSATITGTLAGQVVMSGFISIKVKPWARRLITRAMALIPVLIVIIYFGEQSTTKLLVSSQIFLSVVLPFSMLSLLLITSDRKQMGILVNTAWMKGLGWFCAFMITIANGALLVGLFR